MEARIEHFKNKLGECKKSESTCLIKSSFEKLELPLFYVFDQGGELPVKVVTNEHSYHLTVNNKTGNPVYLVKTDHCLIEVVEGLKRCDCIILNSALLYFVEIKDNIKNTQKSKRRKGASEQITATYNHLLGKGIDFSPFKLYATICINGRDSRIPKVSSNTRSEEFRQIGITLQESNTVTF